MSEQSSRQTLLKQYRECPPLMARMMERIGVEPSDVVCIDGGLAWLEARTRCLFCCHLGTCCDWLVDSDARTTPQEFCANAKLFASLPQRSSGGADTPCI